MSRVRQFIGNMQLPAADKPGWFRYGWIMTEYDNRQTPDKIKAAHEARITAAVAAYQGLITRILQADPTPREIPQQIFTKWRCLEYRAEGVGYITLYDTNENGQWDKVNIGTERPQTREEEEQQQWPIRNDLLDFTDSEGGSLVEKAIDRSVRTLFGQIPVKS